MHLRTSAAIAISVAAAGLCVAGCQGSSSGASSAPSSAPASQAPPASTSQAPASSPSAGQGAGAGQGPGQAGSGGQGVSAGAPCQASALRAAVDTNDGQELNVDLVNSGPVSCTMDGYPGVNLVGTANGQSGYQWPLERGTAVSPSEVTLSPGGSAHFTINYLGYNSGDGRELNVKQIIITPPGQYAHMTATWRQGVVLQDAATHSGTWIEPVQAGA